jgi:hypothetical protein
MLAISPFRVREITNLTTTTLQNITANPWLKLLETDEMQVRSRIKRNSAAFISWQT